jgi:pilus assembly protein Flp/PilA
MIVQRKPLLSGYIIKTHFPKGKEVRVVLCGVRERGQGLVEYAFILVLMAMVVISVLLLLGPVIGNVFTKLNSSLSSY